MVNPVETLDEDLEGTIDLENYANEQEVEDEFGTTDMEEYSQSQEAEQATWWDSIKEAGIQAGLGFGQAFTWPADVLKIAMVGEGLSDIDDLEEAFRKAGKEFDRDKYTKTVLEQGEFIPTQQLLEDKFSEYTGVDLEPKTRTGKFFNKLFFLGGLTRGKGLGKAIKTGVVGATTTAGLRESGAPEIVSELGGDVVSGLASLAKEARQLSPEAARIQKIADKHGLPLMEVMLRDEVPSGPKISAGRKKALEKRLGTTSEEAIDSIIQDKIPAAKLRKQGQDTQVLEELAYDHANQVAQNYPGAIPTTDLVADIEKEVNRIKSLAPSPSDAQKAAIRILENEKEVLSKATPDAAKLIQQTRNYNSNVKSIYRKAEYSGVEDEVKNAYAFLNDRIRSTIEKNGASEVVSANKAANKLFAENSALARTEGLVTKAFQNGEYNPKKLTQVLNSRQGSALRRDIGDQGVKELREIAEFGQKAQKATNQFANSAKHKFQVSEWGPLAGFLLAKLPPVGVAAAAAKPFADYVRGWALTRPEARTVYRNIIKNASNGSFKNMAKDFSTMEDMIVEEFGSMEDFMQQGLNDIQFYREGEEDED